MGVINSFKTGIVPLVKFIHLFIIFHHNKRTSLKYGASLMYSFQKTMCFYENDQLQNANML
jgi:hypothetical protein